MATELKTFDVTTPAGTTKASPQVASLAMPPRLVERIEIMVPTGPNGQLGLQLTTGGQLIYPVDKNTWIIASGEVVNLELTGAIQSGAWQLTSYNTGQYPHTVQVRFYLNVVQQAAQSTPSQPIPLTVLTPLPDATPASSLTDITTPDLIDVTP